MSIRCNEPGWERIGAVCSAGRRALWLKLNYTSEEITRAKARAEQHGLGVIYADPVNVESIELCAGREGDDEYLKIDKSNPQFEGLLAVFLTALYAAES